MTQTDRRYLIEHKTINPTRLSDFGLSREDGQNPEFETKIRGHVTAAEFLAMFGPDARIVESMIHDIETRDNWTATIGVEDVLACEREENSMQYVMINALLDRAGEDELTGTESADRARDYDDMSPEAALFLMEMYDSVYYPADVDAEYELKRFDDAGLTPADLLR